MLLATWHVFLGFLIANVLGYGGGPASIPLMQDQIVQHFHWLTNAKFANVLALGNALPGPIATKIAAYVGFQVAGWWGLLAALVAATVPSAIALIILYRVLHRYRGSAIVKSLNHFVQPVIAVLMLLLTWQLGKDAVRSVGVWQSLLIAAVAFLAINRLKVHPAFVIVGAFAYGGLVIAHVG